MRNCTVKNWDRVTLKNQNQIKSKHMVRELNINTTLLEEREFLNIKDLKETLGTSQNTIYRICDRKELNKYKFRGKCWFRSEEVKSYLIGKGILK
jgi:transcriptional antiterminator